MKQSMTRSSIKILMVEDDVDFAQILKLRLSVEKNPSLEIECVSSLRSACETLSQKRFDLILLDLKLPDSHGINTFARANAHAKHAPIVIMTGLDDDALATEAIRKGAEDYIIKTETNSKLLIRIIHHAIDRHQIKEKLTSVTKKLRQTNLYLEKMATLDPLTELYNRRGLEQILSREVQLAKRHGGKLLVLMMDIDDFKQINDSLGHSVGDMLLKKIAQRIKHSIRMSDYVARIGGDEFILLLTHTPFEEGARLAERLRLTISDMVLCLTENKKVRVTASAGLSHVTPGVTSIDELLSLTDPLLKGSKDSGKNRVFYEESVIEKTKDFSLSKNVAALREGHDFFSLKQPIFNLWDQTIMGYEFLSRFKNGSVNMPHDFFQMALENNILTLVDHHCFRSCVSAASRVAPQIRRHINLLPATIIGISVQQLMKELIADGPGENYCFEISEQQILGDPSCLVGPVETFKQNGIMIAVDDVGFGNTCLESLLLLEPNVIKIDKKYVKGISEDPHAEKSLKHVLKIASNLEAEVIAEGIESYGDLETLKRLGVKFGQGFFLGVPA